MLALDSPPFVKGRKTVGWADARSWMPSAHEPVNPARQAHAWLRAAARLLSPGFDRLSAAG